MAGSPGAKIIGKLALKVLPDTSDFGDELRAYVEAIESAVKVEIPVLVDESGLSDDIARLQGRVEAADLELDVVPEIDASGALAEMNLLLTELQALAALRSPTVNIDVDADTVQIAIGEVAAQSARAVGSSSELGRNIAVWGPLIFAAAVGIAAFAPALAVILPLVAGFAAGIGVVLLSLDELAETFGPLGSAIVDLGDRVGPALVAGMEPFIDLMINRFVPVLGDGLEAFATLMNGAITGVLEFLTSAEGILLVGEFFTGLATALEPFGALLAPLLEVFLRLSIEALPALEAMGDAILDITQDFAGWLEGGDAADAISESMSELGDFLVIVGQLIADLFPPLVAAAPAVIALIAGAAEAFGTLLGALTPVFTWMSENATLMKIIGAVLLGLAVAVAIVAAAMTIAGIVFASTATIIAAAIGAVVGLVLYAYNRFDWFKTAVDFIVKAVATSWRVQFAIIKGIITAGIAVVMSIPGAVMTTYSGVKNSLGLIAGAFSGMVDAVGRFIGNAIDFVQQMPGRIKLALIGAGTMLYETGRQIIEGLINGIRDFANNAVDAAKGVVGDAIGGAKNLLGINSPSRVFRDIGRDTIAGLALGLHDERSTVVSAMGEIADLMSLPPIEPQSLWSDEAFRQAFDPTSVDIQGRGGPTRFVMDDWARGTGYFEDVADDRYAQQTAINDTRNLMGVG